MLHHRAVIISENVDSILMLNQQIYGGQSCRVSIGGDFDPGLLMALSIHRQNARIIPTNDHRPRQVIHSNAIDS